MGSAMEKVQINVLFYFRGGFSDIVVPVMIHQVPDYHDLMQISFFTQYLKSNWELFDRRKDLNLEEAAIHELASK